MEKSKIILDSGAFSAWNKGKKIDIDDYISFCIKNQEIIDYIVSLDVIPGAPFVKLTEQDRRNSAIEGWRNYKKMLNAGIPADKLIHVFHQGEDFRWLEKMANEIPYIGISPTNDKTTFQKLVWLNECRKYITDKEGNAKVKIHGFAVTSLKLVFDFPWYSVDSSSWSLRGMGFGLLDAPSKTPPIKKEDYYITSIPISQGVKKYKNFDNEGLFSIPRQTQAEVSFYMKKNYRKEVEILLNSYGFSFEKIKENHNLCAIWNAIYLIETVSKFTSVKVFLTGNNISQYMLLLEKMKENKIETNKLNILTSFAFIPKKAKNLNFIQKINQIL